MHMGNECLRARFSLETKANKCVKLAENRSPCAELVDLFAAVLVVWTQRDESDNEWKASKNNPFFIIFMRCRFIIYRARRDIIIL